MPRWNILLSTCLTLKKLITGLGKWLSQWYACCASMKAWIKSPASIGKKPGVVTHSCSPRALLWPHCAYFRVLLHKARFLFAHLSKPKIMPADAGLTGSLFTP